MATDMPSTPFIAAPSNAAYLLFAVVVLTLCAVAYSYGRDARLKADAAEAVLLQEENHTFCSGLGFASGSAAYASCTEGLAKIRQRQKERWETDAAGLI